MSDGSVKVDDYTVGTVDVTVSTAPRLLSEAPANDLGKGRALRLASADDGFLPGTGSDAHPDAHRPPEVGGRPRHVPGTHGPAQLLGRGGPRQQGEAPNAAAPVSGETAPDPVAQASGGDAPRPSPDPRDSTSGSPDREQALSSLPNNELPAEPTDIGGMPVDGAAMAAGLRRLLLDILKIPERAFQSIQFYEETGIYDPGPILDAASLALGRPPVGPLRAGEKAAVEGLAKDLTKTAEAKKAAQPAGVPPPPAQTSVAGLPKPAARPTLRPTKADLDAYRAELKVPDTQTVAVGKSDVPGMEGKTFKGAAPRVRQEAGLPPLDESLPNREIKSPSLDVRGTRHAEEGVINEFDQAVKDARLEPEDVKGTLYVHQSNPRGVCPTCIQGINNPDVDPGIFRQLSEKYRNLTIDVTSETVPGLKAVGRHSFRLKDGKFLE
jgi:hypothetical protein